MDRNAFALIAGTVFLLFIINAVIQMQTAMVREAAGGVSVDYKEATWESAGALHLLRNEHTSVALGVYYESDHLANAVHLDANECSLEGNDRFVNQGGELRLDFMNVETLGNQDAKNKLDNCISGGWVRSVPLYVGADNVVWGGVEKSG